MKKLMLVASLTAAANAGFCAGARAQAVDTDTTQEPTSGSVAAPADATADAADDAPLPVIALPDEAPPPVPSAQEPEHRGIAEVIVTAQRREQSAQDVPISMTVLSPEQLANANITNSSDLANYTPSLSLNTRFGAENAMFAIRGFTQDLRTTASVATYFAEVVAPRGQSLQNSGDGAGPGSLFDLENVQVLKGPQGTLFGRNTTGGAVLIVPKKPTDRFEGYIEGSGGDFDARRLQAVVNVPLTDTFKLRAGIDRNQRDGHLTNVTGIGADHLGDTDYTAGRLSLVWNLSDTLENYTIGTFVDSDTNGYSAALFACNPGSLIGLLAGPTSCTGQLSRQEANGQNGFYDLASTVANPSSVIKERRLINTTTWNISDEITAKNIVAYGHLVTENESDVFGTNFHSPLDLNQNRLFSVGISVRNPDIPVTSQETWVEELQFQGNFFDGRLQSQAGVYFEHSLPDGYSGNNSTALISCNPASLELDPSQFDCFDPTGGLLSGVLVYQFKTDYLNRAVYTQSTFDFTDKFSMTGGLRYTWDRTSGESIKSRYRFLTAIPLGPVTEETSPSVSSKAPTGMIEMEYKPVRDVMAYAKYVRGYRQGSVNMAAPTAFDTFKPEHVNTYEIGAKTTFRGPVPIRFNVAAFDNELTDMQLQTGVVSFAPTTIIFNAGKARIRGVEVEAFAELLTDLTLSLSYSHLDTKLLKQDDHRRDVLAAGFTPEQLAQLSLSGLIAFATYTPIADVGDSLPFAADNTVVASLSYRLPFPAAIGDVAIGATYAYTGKRRTAASSSSPNDILDPFELLNLNLNWTNIFGAPVDLAAFATNVLQEKYATYASGTYNTTGVDSRMVGLPRMIGARLKYRFGN